MGRRPIGVRKLTATERQQRWRAKRLKSAPRVVTKSALKKPTRDLRPPDDQAERRAVLRMLDEMLGELGEVLDGPEPVAAPFVTGWRMGLEQSMHIVGRRIREVRTLDWSPVLLDAKHVARIDRRSFQIGSIMVQ
jgi:hypothetical protein